MKLANYLSDSMSAKQRHDASTNRREFAKKSKSDLSCNLNYLSEKVTQRQLVFEEDTENSCGEQI